MLRNFYLTLFVSIFWKKFGQSLIFGGFVLLPYLLVTPSVTPITSKEAVGQGHAREMSSISIQGLGEEEGCWEGGVEALLELHILPL